MPVIPSTQQIEDCEFQASQDKVSETLCQKPKKNKKARNIAKGLSHSPIKHKALDSIASIKKNWGKILFTYWINT
jgi:hypothetical protein